MSIGYAPCMFSFWNTQTRAPQTLAPIATNKIGLYTCGPTVYNQATIGNLRSYLFEDVLKKSLEYAGFKVHHVMNITDVGHLVGDGDEGEDKMEKAASLQGKNAWELAKYYEELFAKDAALLHIDLPQGKDRPHATEYIKEQIELVQVLEQKGFTYRTSDGIYFDTSKFQGYGKLSGQNLADKEAGARVEVNPEKRNPSDFALWKFSPTDQKRQMEWESPWGVGFPGWHIECSVMSERLLGQPFDIHCGGVDHISVHHENEIAQSEAAYGKPLANLWMHNEFLLIDGGRMGKSLGNAYVLEDLIAKGFDPLAYRYFCLLAHYRSKLNFTWDALTAAQNALKNLRQLVRGLPKAQPEGEWIQRTEFQEALENDLNTAKGIAILWDVLKSEFSNEEKANAVADIDKVFSLGLSDLLGKTVEVPYDIRQLAEERQEARQSKDWKKSDELRDELKASGWEIKDGPDGYELTSLE